MADYDTSEHVDFPTTGGLNVSTLSVQALNDRCKAITSEAFDAAPRRSEHDAKKGNSVSRRAIRCPIRLWSYGR